MPATFLEGRRRSGKSLYAVLKIQEYLKEGRRVATNLDLNLEHLMPDTPKANVTRLPDFPRSTDLFSLGYAYDLDPKNSDTYDENKNGLVVLDELLTSFNSRSWNNKDRLNVINWIVLSGKIGWDLIFIGQAFEAVDTQIRDTVIDRIGSCTSNENLYPGFIWNYIVKPFYMRIFGQKHIVYMYFGKTKAKENFSHKITHKRYDLYKAYNTSQLFFKDVEVLINDKGKEIEKDNRANYSVIGNHYFGDRMIKSNVFSKSNIIKSDQFKPKKQLPKFKFNKLHFLAFFSFLFLLYFLYQGNSDTYITSNTEEPGTTQEPESEPVPTKKVINYTQQKLDLESSDLGQIYITCSSFRTDGGYSYCFSDGNNIIEPTNIGYKVLYVSDCHAKLYRNGATLNAYCNPVQEIYDPEREGSSEFSEVGLQASLN